MKHFIQSVATVLLALMIGQPVFATSNCLELLQRQDKCLDPCCSGHDHGMSTHGHAGCMPSADDLHAGSGCGEAGCRITAPSVLENLWPTTSKSVYPAPHGVATMQFTPAQTVCVSHWNPGVDVPTPPRRILFQTFRI